MRNPRELPEIFARCRDTYGCFIHAADPRNALDVTQAEHEAFYEKLYHLPGFAFWQGNFRDILTDRAANDTVTEFVTKKIRARVRDPKVADLLIPKDHGFGTRGPAQSGYYESTTSRTWNSSTCATPIERVMPTGLRTSARDYEFDMILYATGFDAITGGFDRIDIRGRDGRRLKEKWEDGPQTYLGLQSEGFPNLLTLIGPHNAATFCNMPRCIEQNVDWVTDLLLHMRARGLTRVEASSAAEQSWTAHE
jgi:cation diffusion facilitator CzcD-associated flavoprotein CzcO